MKRPRRWIAQEIERLDPERDYETIWRLTSSYGLDDFALNLVYAHLFPHFYLPSHGARPLWHQGDGKVVERATQRVEDTVRNNLVWWFYGPGHPKTQQSVANINKLHAFHARRYPGTFAAQEDYVFTLAFSAASLHRFNLKVGLPGYTEKQKTAAHLFWKHMAELFVDEHGGPVLGYPEDWDTLVAFVEEFESRPWPASQEGEMVTKTIMDQFAFRFFPRPLHALGRAIAISTWHPNCWRAHSVTPPPPWVRRILLRLCGLAIRTQKALKPDPVTAYQEVLEAQSKNERRDRSRRIRELDSAFSAFFRRRHGLPPRAASPGHEHAPASASFAE
ncbi:hypothetical protein [Streptomyces fuscichromogenes]|uniref:ER-bound oxygenase mpaB/mpaB'/Rubber oxygenase catalytic domain-containing protein n=1 Tax=Streptomyces fuscichromogenes TaxID=1324013 RepID=A0A917XH23_9ACTN|nr:hypothetical protein [Streptomyces fuscichromogenes]GGN22637.1 hypothetical protein GCM10011578_054470 [Streptomyces fuscichromogenes]